MRRAGCRSCKSSLPIAKLYVIDGVMVCEPCATRRVKDARAGGRELKVQRALDPTLCAECGADKGDSDWLKVAGTPLCFRCRQRFYEVPYPAWLRVVLLLLAALAGYAVWHALPYLGPAEALARGRRLLAEQRYAAAAVEFGQALEAGSASDDVLLLTVKAHLLAGDYERARLLMNGHPRFQPAPLYYEVLKIWERAVQASDLAAEAQRLATAGTQRAAAGKARAAAELYPERRVLADTARALEAQLAPAEGKPHP
jgi:hypothetical protein